MNYTNNWFYISLKKGIDLMVWTYYKAEWFYITKAVPWEMRRGGDQGIGELGEWEKGGFEWWKGEDGW